MLNFKMRRHPTKEQERHPEETCDVNRILYNYFVHSKLGRRNDMNYYLKELQAPRMEQAISGYKGERK